MAGNRLVTTPHIIPKFSPPFSHPSRFQQLSPIQNSGTGISIKSTNLNRYAGLTRKDNPNPSTGGSGLDFCQDKKKLKSFKGGKGSRVRSRA